MVLAALEPAHRPRHRPAARPGRRRRRLHPVVLRPPRRRPDPALAWGQGHAWLFPIGVDMALVFFEVLLLGASMVRITDHGRVVQYPRAIPFLLMLVAAAGTLYFNATHVPTQVRPLALAVPVASILVTLGLAYLLKMLAAASGRRGHPPRSPGPGAQPHRPPPATCSTASSSATPRSPAAAPQPRTGRCPPGRLRNSTKTASRRWPVTAGGADQAPPGRGLPGRPRPRPAPTPDHPGAPGRRPRADRHPQRPGHAGLRTLRAADPRRLDRRHPPAGQRAPPHPLSRQRRGRGPTHLPGEPR